MMQLFAKVWTWFICGCLLTVLFVCCYEYVVYDLASSTDLSAISIAKLGFQKCEMIDEIHVTGVSLFLVDFGGQDEVAIIAFPRSMFLHRFKSDMQHFFVDRGEFYRFTCEFAQLHFHSFQLRSLGPYDYSKTSMHYNFTIWGSTEDLVYSAINSPHMKWIIFGHLLVPYLCIFTICGTIFMGIRLHLKKRKT